MGLVGGVPKVEDVLTGGLALSPPHPRVFAMACYIALYGLMHSDTIIYCILTA